MIRQRPVAPIVLIAIAGTALFAMPGYAEPGEPVQKVQVEALAVDLEAVEAWIETPLGQSSKRSRPTRRSPRTVAWLRCSPCRSSTTGRSR